MKWLNNGSQKSLRFLQLFLHYILFGKSFIGKVKAPLYLVCLNLNHEKTKVEKMVVLVKIFDHYHHKFQLLQLSYKIVKEFETIQF